MQMQNNTGVLLFCVDNFFVVGVAQESKRYTVRTQRRLNDIGDIVLICFRVKIGQVFATMVLMTSQVIVCAVGNPPQFAPAEWEQILNIGRCLGVEGEFFFLMVAQTQVLFGQAERMQPVFAEVFPVLEPFEIRVRLAEEFTFHLLKFTGAEREVAGGNFVAEALANLAYAERQLFACGALNVGKVHKDTLRGFRTQINGVLCVLCDALKGFEHQVKLTNVREVFTAAVGAFDVVFLDELHHLFVAPAIGRLAGEVLNQFVRTVACFAVFAVHQRVGKSAHMAGSHPNFRIHQNSGVEADIVRAFLYKFFQPCLFHVVFEFHTQRTVVPGVG